MTTDVQPAPPAEEYGLQVSPRCYVSVWYFTLVMRVLCCAFLSFTTFIYFFLAQPEMSYYAAMLGPSAASGLKPRFYLKLYGRRGIFGVESKYFELNFAFRETMEIASQTFQAYSSSLLIASPAINTLYVLTIIFNCWSGPIVRYFCRKVDAEARRSRRVHAITRRLSSQTGIAEIYLESKAMALERVCCLVTELVLDAGAAMLVPGIIFLPYSRVFDMQKSAFPIELTEFPVVLTRLQVKDLSLYGNRLTSMHSVRFGDDFDKLSTLVLSGMPLRELPTSMPTNIRKHGRFPLEIVTQMRVPRAYQWTSSGSPSGVFGSSGPGRGGCSSSVVHRLSGYTPDSQLYACVSRSCASVKPSAINICKRTIV
ncbi:hypothetical protein Gpo141_00001593 [Globisporangium polare]